MSEKGWVLRDRDRTVERLLEVVRLELESATAKFGPMASAHEGYAVILEEMDELWEAIKSKEASREDVQDEAVQVAAMASRDCLDKTCGAAYGSRRSPSRRASSLPWI